MVVTPLPRTAARRQARRSAKALLAQAHTVQWRTISPLWSQFEHANETFLQRQNRFRQPVILRFTSDRFMEDFLAIAKNAPQRLGEWQAQWESWRSPAPILQLPSTASTEAGNPFQPTSTKPLKLYQPAHQRYYLISANLVCRMPGLPDKEVKVGEETVSFVLRRRLKTASDELKEHALVEGSWQLVDNGEQRVPNEKTFPMFPVTYRESGQRRRVFSGLIPVGEREQYLNAPRQLASKAAASKNSTFGDRAKSEEQLDRLMTLFMLDVAAPWSELLDQVGNNPIDGEPNSGDYGPLTRTLKESLEDSNTPRSQLKTTTEGQRDQLQLQSWYILLDFANFLQAYLPNVWNAISTGVSLILTSPQRALYDKLIAVEFQPRDPGPFDLGSSQSYYELLVKSAPAKPSVSLAQALVDTKLKETFLESTALPFSETASNSWPTSRFLLTGQGLRSHLNTLNDQRNPITSQRIRPGLIRQALAEMPNLRDRTLPDVPLAQAVSQPAQASDINNNLFTIRCIYERPNCPPTLHPTVVSEPTAPFELAAYYDPDAPTRPIRIPMPIDTTPGGLRKYAKNTAFVISNTLGCQLEKANSISFGDLVRSVLPWPFHKDLKTTASTACNNTGSLQFGKLLTLSIPIITLCALLLLMIIVKLLDMIFRWVPFFLVWLPIPGLKAKETP